MIILYIFVIFYIVGLIFLKCTIYLTRYKNEQFFLENGISNRNFERNPTIENYYPRENESFFFTTDRKNRYILWIVKIVK